MLIERPSGLIVRKGTTKPVQNQRLRAQCAKLRAARALGIACPNVLEEGEDDDGCFYFDMDYVAGESLANAVLSGRELHWDVIMPQIRRLLDCFRQDQPGSLHADVFRSKLENIAAQCHNRATTSPLLDRIDRIVAGLQRMNWNDVPQSGCHGDLTLENIMLRHDGSVVFIDFDVPEQSSWHLDIGKLYQDVWGHWCLRQLALSEPGSVDLVNAQVRLQQIEAVFAEQIGSLVPGGRARVQQLAAFHLLRTLPYASDSRVAHYVVGRTEAVLSVP